MDKKEIEGITRAVLDGRGLGKWTVTWVQQRDAINAWSVAVGDGDHHCPIESQSESRLTEDLVRRFISRGIDACLGEHTTF